MKASAAYAAACSAARLFLPSPINTCKACVFEQQRTVNDAAGKTAQSNSGLMTLMCNEKGAEGAECSRRENVAS